MNRRAAHRPRTARLAAVVALLFAPHGAQAAHDLTGLGLEKLLEMRVIAASSYEQAAAEAPSAVTVITAEDIRSHGYRTLADALRSVPGLYVTEDLNYTYLGSRGFNRIGDYNSRFQLSVNGLRTNDPLFDMAYIGTEFPIDMALIERIEFAPGPGSSIYGSNAVLGVINVVTRKGGDLAGLRVAPAVGSHGMRELSVSYGQHYASGLEVLAGVSGLSEDSQSFHFPAYDSPATNGGIAANQNGQRYRRGYLRASYGGFDLEVFGGKRIKASPSIYSGGDFSNANQLTDRLAFAALSYRREIAPHTQLEARLSASRYDYTGVYPGDSGVVNRDDAVGRSRGAEFRLVSTRWQGHKVVAGVEYQDDAALDQSNVDLDPAFTYLDRHDAGRRNAVYVQDEIRLGANWLLNAGARHDRHYAFKTSTNPRLALIGELAPGTTVKLLYGSAFRAPNAYELYYETSGYDSNAMLEPERTRATEFVIEQQLGDRTRWRGSVYHYRFSDLIEQVDEDGAYVFRNRSAVTGRGIELAFAALLPHGARFDASVSFDDVRQSDGQRLSNSPRYTAKATVEAPIADSGIRGALHLGAIGPRLGRDRDPVATTITSQLTFTTRAWLGATYTLSIRNLLDRPNMDPTSEYFAVAQVPGPGRSAWLGAEWRF